MGFEDFKTAYEDVHVPLVRDMAGDSFPNFHARHYVSRIPAVDGSNETVAEVLSGDAAMIPYDAISEMTFNSRQHYEEFATRITSGENAAKMAEDCAKFLDITKPYTMVVVSDYIETKLD